MQYGLIRSLKRDHYKLKISGSGCDMILGLAHTICTRNTGNYRGMVGGSNTCFTFFYLSLIILVFILELK